MNILELHGLVKTYKQGARALDGLDLDVKKAQILGLLGPNGAGKSSTINILAGIIRVDELLDYFDLRDKPEVLIQTYPNSMKKKICLAAALI